MNRAILQALMAAIIDGPSIGEHSLSINQAVDRADSMLSEIERRYELEGASPDWTGGKS